MTDRTRTEQRRRERIRAREQEREADQRRQAQQVRTLRAVTDPERQQLLLREAAERFLPRYINGGVPTWERALESRFWRVALVSTLSPPNA